MRFFSLLRRCLRFSSFAPCRRLASDQARAAAPTGTRLRPRWRLGLVAAAAALPFAGAAPVAPTAPTVEALFRDYDSMQISLSPDGTKLASVFPWEYERDVWRFGLAVIDVETAAPKVLHRDREASIQTLHWVADHRLLVGTITHGYRRALFAFDPDGSNATTLSALEKPSRLINTVPITARLVGPREALFARPRLGARYEEQKPWRFDGEPPLPGVYRVNIDTGAHELAVRDPGWTREWFVDRHGVVRVASGYDPAAFKRDGSLRDPAAEVPGVVMWIRDDGEASVIGAIQTGLLEEYRPLGFEPDGERFLFQGRQGGEAVAVWAYNPVTQAVEGPVFTSPVGDVRGAIISPLDGSVSGVLGHEGGAVIPRWLDPTLQELQPMVDEALPEFRNLFVEWSRDLSRVLILSVSAQEPGRYYLLDRRKGTLAEVYQRAPWLRQFHLGATTPVTFKARDGLVLHGLLTRPPGAAEGARLPLVLLVHGGPWFIRDAGGFDPEAHLYATRGYAVLQVNYRGSGGYGRTHLEGARHQFGGAMIDDLEDAVKWAVDTGVADPDRLVASGASYGGYAVLRLLTTRPGLFRAGISLFPVADLVQQIEDYGKVGWNDPGFLNAQRFWQEWVGDPATERAQLEAQSPQRHLGRLQEPLFIVYGEDDDRISYQQSAQLVKTLRALGKDFVRFAPRREGHGLAREEHRFKIYEALEKFLRQRVPAD